jgi:hypothetical protein
MAVLGSKLRVEQKSSSQKSRRVLLRREVKASENTSDTSETANDFSGKMGDLYAGAFDVVD